MRNACLVVVMAAAAPVLADEPKQQDGEVIVIHETYPGRLPKPSRAAHLPPPYSDEAIDRDEIYRAWAVLDIDEIGKVTRVRFVRKAGLGLDDLAARKALTYRFEPATDAGGKPVATRILWRFDWPSYWQARDIEGVQWDPCTHGAGPLNLGSYHITKANCELPTDAEIRAAIGPTSLRAPKRDPHPKPWPQMHSTVRSAPPVN